MLCLVVYGFAASVLPVWMLLAPRDYLSTFMKVGTIGLLAVGILLTLPVLQNQAVTKFASSGNGPVFAGPLFPFVFIIIACGALSGFHALIASGTTPKLIEKQSQVRMIGYGAMLTESFVAVMAMVAASILDQGLYFAMNAPAGVVGTTVQSASEAVTKLGFTIGPDQLQAAAQSVQEQSLIARVGGAPTLAVGMSTIFSGAFGGRRSRRSGTTSRSCSRPCSSSPRSTRARGWAASCCRTRSATSGSRWAGRRGGRATAQELEELAADAGAADAPGAGDQVVARLDAASRAHEGETLRLWVDTRKLHLFNPDNGAHLTL